MSYDNLLITEVEDSGIGMEEEEINKLFKFFGKASDSGNINQCGMGLGLTISKMLV